ncbi:MAG: hypothetical protein KC996_08685 [Phycisphaerales bacterium]|nr:hypothetical protein [Phycisphaerales bacterium]
MSNRGSSPSIITQFLGDEAGVGGPFALLGVPYETDEHQILRARDRRLAQIDQHPHSRTPDADEVRLAVHAASSQLLSPELRVQLQARWPAGNPNSTPTAWHPRKNIRVQGRVTRSARMILGMCGGWNSRSRRQLAHLARINHVPAIELIRSLCGEYESHSTKPSPQNLRRVLPLPSGSKATWFIIYAGFACMMGAIIYQAYTPGNTGSPPPEPAASVQGPIDPSPLAGSPTSSGSKRSITHYSALVHEVAQAKKLAQSDPNAAIKHITGLMPVFMDLWTEIPSTELEQIVQSLRAIDLSSKTDPLAPQLGDTLVGYAAAKAPSRYIAAAALKEYLAQESNASLVSFGEYLTEAARHLANESITDDPVWWSSWIDAAQSIHQPGEPAQSALILDAISGRLHDPNPSPSWAKTASLFVKNFSWRPGSPERPWLLGVFADPDVHPERLVPLTEAVATGSSASGVLVTMVLPPNATMQRRADLAERYREAWARTATDPFLDRLTDSMLSAISLAAVDPDPQLAQDRFAELARLNAVCALIEQGENARAVVLFETPVMKANPPSHPQSLGLDQDPEDDRLALSLINADNADGELAVLYEIESKPRIGLNTAHAVVQVALTGSTRESRDFAAQLIRNHRESLPLLLALDRVLFVNRTTTRLQQIILAALDTSTEYHGDDWDSWAHRLLLSAIAGAASGGSDPTSNGFDEVVAAYYTPRLFPASSESLQTRNLCEMLITQYGAAALRGTDPDGVHKILSQRRIRRARAESVAQGFAADQWSIFELHSLILIEQHPGAKSQILRIADELNTRCTQAQSVAAQITQLERAQAQLWLLHFREGSV